METIAEGEIVKMDTQGRMRTRRARRAELLAEFERSGMSGQAFAKWAGIKYTTFANWRQKQKREIASVSKPPRDLKPVHWVEAVVGEASASPAKSSGLMIELGSGLRLSIGDADQARLAGVVLREVLQGANRC